MTLPSPFAAPRRALLWRLLANGVGQALAAGALLLLLRHAFDLLMAAPAGALPAGWYGSGVALLACAAATAWLRRRECVDAERLGQDYVQAVRRRLFRRVLSIPARDQHRRRSGTTMLRLFGDMSALRNWVSRGIARLLVSGLASVGMLVVLGAMDAWLALAVALVSAAGGAVLLLVGRRLKRTLDVARRRRARLAGHVGDVLASMATVQGCARVRHEQRRMTRHGERLAQAMTERAAALGTTRAAVAATTVLASTVALLVGGLRVSAGATGPGSVVAAIGVVGLLVAPLRDLGRVYEYWCAAKVARQKLRAVLDYPGRRLRQGRRPLPDGAGALRLRGLWFGDLLRDINAGIAPGSRVLVTGANGVGKSTLLQIIAGQLRADRGRVRLDGADPARLSPAAARTALAMVSMAVPPVRGSLRRNLRYGQPDASEEELRAIIERCGLAPLRTRRIAAGGENLSQGERQRLLLARALVRPPRVLLLDEVDAHLDAGNRRLLRSLLDDYRGTLVMVSHTDGWESLVDAVWELADGRLTRRPGARATTTGMAPGEPGRRLTCV